MSAADAQRFDAVGEGLVGADAGEGDVGPVLVEPFPGVVDRVAPPTVVLFVAVVGGLFSGEPSDFGVGGGDGSGGIDRCGVAPRQLVVERSSLGATVSGEGGEHADLVEVVADVVDGGVGGRECVACGGELAAGVVELALPVGRLPVEDVLVGGDQLAEFGVDGPRVVDGGHGGVGDAGQGDGDLLVGVGSVGEAAAEVDGRQGGGVPGVGGLDGAGLGGVAAVGVEGGGAEQVDVVPGRVSPLRRVEIPKPGPVRPDRSGSPLWLTGW